MKHTYQSAWYLPGGGLKRGETVEEAVRREVQEEVGGKLRQLRLAGIYTNFTQGKTDHIIFFISEDFTWQVQPRRAEIERVAEFSLDQLPSELSGGTKRRLAEYLNDTAGDGKSAAMLGLW